MKEFNTTGICFPDRHYMVDTSDRIQRIIDELIKKNKYFTINRARQYGKTTTISRLRDALRDDYYVAKISFEGLGEAAKSESRFIQMFINEVKRQLSMTAIPKELLAAWSAPFIMPDASVSGESLVQLGERITNLCTQSDREIILFIDEVDGISNNELFLSFLGMLRRKYLSASEGDDSTFKSVVLAGVYDIKNIQVKMRPDKDHQYNSPWNITADFDVDMSFHVGEIETMLKEYREDQGFDFDTAWFAEQIYAYTSGYPFLVSRLCWLLDTKVWIDPDFGSKQAAWSQDGFQRAVKLILKEQNTLFDDLNKKLDSDENLKNLVYRIVVCRENIPFNLNDNLIKFGAMFGWFKDLNGKTVISNRIFETIICDKLLQERTTTRIYKEGVLETFQLKTSTELNMDKIIERFAVHYKSMYADRTSDFLENEARMIFLTFLKPIINGSGNYYMEPEAFDKTRTDIVVDYGGRQYVVEAKIWHGESYEQSGREQLCGYLKRYNLPVGWLISFCFNKNKDTLVGTREIQMDGKIIRETVL
ncbi:MAG: AAA-like domain-containing protein [Lachnospiraceae bacterium]|nr:AAA-like domain-containing protein [Lachnospiraceae bacterium]